MADHMTSARMRILEVLIVLTAVGSVYSGMQQLRETIGQDPYLFLNVIYNFKRSVTIVYQLLDFSGTLDCDCVGI